MSIKLFNQRFSINELWKMKWSLMRPPLHLGKDYNFSLNRLSQFLRSTHAWGLPPFLMIEPTSRCDMACPICFVRDRKGKYPTGDMPLEQYKQIMDEVGGTLITLALWGYGEPLLNRNLPQMISYAREMGVFTTVSTNAFSLDEEIADALIDSRLDYCIVSVDGASEETYAMYRSPGKFARVVENIATLTKRKRARRSVTPFVNIQFIVMRGNEHEIPAMRKLAHELGADKLSLKKAWVFTKEEERTVLPSDPVYHLKIYSRELDRGICTRPWNTPFITWKGDVLVCCADFGCCALMGNVFGNGGFGAVWNSHRFRSFRVAMIKDINKIDICRRCGAKNYKDGFVPLE